ncbi:MAG: CHASE2 domain-containing protein [Pseudomonadota bacterium]
MKQTSILKRSGFRKSGWPAAAPLIGVTALMAILSIVALSTAGARTGGMRAGLFDLYQRLAPSEAAPVQRFHVVEIDAETIDRIGPWPWPRSELARLVEAASGAGAKAAILVEPLDRPDPLSPATIGAFWLEGARDEGLARELRRLPDTDATLGEALAAVQSAFAIDPGPRLALSDQARLAAAVAQDADWIDARAGGQDGARLAASERIALPGARARSAVAAPLRDGARLAVGALPADGDGVFRAPILAWSVDETPAPSLALEAARAALGLQTVGVEIDPTATTPFGRVVKSVSLGEESISVDRLGRAVIEWPKEVAAPTTPAWRLIDGSAGSNAQLAGKVTLIGLSADLDGVVRTPRGDISKAAAHAVVADRLVVGALAARPGWIGYVEALAVMAFGAGAIVWSQSLSFWRSLGVAALIAFAVLAASVGAYAGAKVLFDPLPSILAVFLGAAAVAGGRSIGEAMSDEAVRGNFKGALPEPTMRKLREEGPTDVLEGDEREISILSCELSFFDEDKAKFAGRPGDMTTHIASACQSLRKVIVDMGGAVDQADGGKVFGYFNAPLETADHPQAACTAALRLVEAMDGINSGLNGGPGARDVQLRLAIGVATGPCLVGPMGHGRSNRYSAIGEAMELAQFLRKQAAFYGPAIICDETVHRRTHHNFAFLELDQVHMRGASSPATLYALVGNPFLKSSKGFRALDGAHRDMLAAYRSGDAQGAKLNLLRARRSPGANIALFDIYEERIAALEADGERAAEPTQTVVI